MKKQYGTPEAEKLEFDYKDAIVASAVRGKNLPLRALSTQRQGWTQAAPFPPAKEGKPFAACRRGSRSPGLHVARWYRRIRNAPIATRGTDARPRKSSARKRSFAHIPCVGLRHPSERRESTPVSKTCHSA